MLNTRRNNQPRFVYKGLLIDQLNGILPSNQQEGALFLGSQDALQERKLNRLGIKAVVSAVKILPPIPDCIKYHLVVPVEDQQSQPLFQFFEQVFKFVQQARKKSNVLIHCQAGVSRSATLAIAYLMKKYSWKVSTAYDLVKRRRIVACPNFGFCQQLLAYQKNIILSTEWRIQDDKIVFRQQKKREEDKSTTDDPETRESIAFSSGMIKRSKLRQSWI